VQNRTGPGSRGGRPACRARPADRTRRAGHGSRPRTGCRLPAASRPSGRL